jgi:hypothetical protein
VEQTKRLVAIDRYLYLRNGGAAEFAQHYSAKAAENPDTVVELREAELEIWETARESAVRLWQETCELVRNKLEHSATLVAWWDERAAFFQTAVGSELVVHDISVGVEKLRLLRADSRKLVKQVFEQSTHLYLNGEGLLVETTEIHGFGAVEGLISITSPLRLQQAYTGGNDFDFSQSQLDELGEIYSTTLIQPWNEFLLGQPTATQIQKEGQRLVSEVFDGMWGVLLPKQQEMLTAKAKFQLELLAGPLQLFERHDCDAVLKSRLKQLFAEYRHELRRIETRRQEQLFQLLREHGHLDGRFTSDDRPVFLPPSLIVIEAYGRK